MATVSPTCSVRIVASSMGVVSFTSAMAARSYRFGDSVGMALRAGSLCVRERPARGNAHSKRGRGDLDLRVIQDEPRLLLRRRRLLRGVQRQQSVEKECLPRFHASEYRQSFGGVEDLRVIFTWLIRSIQPVRNLSLQIEVRAAAAERPAHVGDGDEEGSRKAIELADLAAEKGRFSAEAHRSDSRLIRLLDDARFEPRELLIIVDVVHRPQQLFFRERVTGAAVAADANAENAGAAALSLRLEDAVENGVLDSSEIASAEVGMRERILRVHVLAEIGRASC